MGLGAFASALTLSDSGSLTLAAGAESPLARWTAGPLGHWIAGSLDRSVKFAQLTPTAPGGPFFHIRAYVGRYLTYTQTCA